MLSSYGAMEGIDIGIPVSGLGSGWWYAIPSDHPLGLITSSNDRSSNEPTAAARPPLAATWGSSSLSPSQSIAQSCCAATNSKRDNTRGLAPNPLSFHSCERDTITIALQLLGQQTSRHYNSSSIAGGGAATGLFDEAHHWPSIEAPSYVSSNRDSSCRMAAAHSKPAPSVTVGERCCTPQHAQMPALPAQSAVSGAWHGNRLLVCPHAPARARPPVMLVPAAEMAPYAHLLKH